MIYEYDEKVVNHSNNFFDSNKFVGYILPDGTIYPCKNHNITNVFTFLKMYLELLDVHYNRKNELLNSGTDDKLARVVLDKLKSMSHDEIRALLKFTKNEIILSDLLVCFFGCHLITRLRRNMITSEANHTSFYNYLLHDFKIDTFPRIVYDESSKEFRYVEAMDRNGYLYDEIDEIKKDVKEEDISLFHKTR